MQLTIKFQQWCLYLYQTLSKICTRLGIIIYFKVFRHQYYVQSRIKYWIYLRECFNWTDFSCESLNECITSFCISNLWCYVTMDQKIMVGRVTDSLINMQYISRISCVKHERICYSWNVNSALHRKSSHPILSYLVLYGVLF